MFQALQTKCVAAGQGHLLLFWEQLSEKERQSLAAQIDRLDLERVNLIYKQAIDAEKSLRASSDQDAFNPLPDEAFVSIIDNPKRAEEWRAAGLQAIANGQVAVLLMAGGQGTRLGSSAPKGCYDIGLFSHQSLFQIQAERILRLQTLASRLKPQSNGSIVIPWYIMTSGPTRQDTETFFKEHNFFGLEPSNVVIIEQATLPCLTMDGKIILDAPSNIAVAPDGNGGLYAALRRRISSDQPKRTVLTDLEQRGVQYIHAFGVDNCLVRVADPVFLGCGISKNADCAVKVVRKNSPTEPVGVVAMRGSKYSVVEYSEISSEQASRLDPQTGELLFRAANIANHFYTIDFLKSVEAFENQLAFHIARKKIPHVHEITGQLIKPTKPNGMKLELFVFDVFPFAHNFAVMEVERKEEFSPLKNAPGTGSDDPETSRADILAQHKIFLENAGACLAPGVNVELSALVTYSGEGLEAARGRLFSESCFVRTADDLLAKSEIA